MSPTEEIKNQKHRALRSATITLSTKTVGYHHVSYSASDSLCCFVDFSIVRYCIKSEIAVIIKLVDAQIGEEVSEGK
jgi:UDP-N-acetylglucosamine pyrophosphorylase